LTNPDHAHRLAGNIDRVHMKRTCIVMTALVGLSAMVATVVGQSPHVAATTRSEWITFNPVTPLTAVTFANPPAIDWPWVRLNLPTGADPAEIQAEVHQMHLAGIAGIEVGQGAFPNNDQLLALLNAATQAGIKVSLSHGPTQSPAGYSIDSDHARKTLYFGKAAVDAGATFDGPLPAGAQTVVGRGGFGGIGGRGAGVGPPPAGAGGGRAGGGGGRGGPQASRTTLIAVLAYRCIATPCPLTGPAVLDRSSGVDLTATLTSKNTVAYSAGRPRVRSDGSPRPLRPVHSGKSSRSGLGASRHNQTRSARKATRSWSEAWRPA
jgi:hypothetical protein